MKAIKLILDKKQKVRFRLTIPFYRGTKTNFKENPTKVLFSWLYYVEGGILPHNTKDRSYCMFDEDAWMDDVTTELDEYSNRMENHDSMAYEQGFEDELSYSSAHSKRSRQMKAQQYE